MMVEGDGDRRGRKLQITFRIITVLFVLAVAEAAAIGWLLTRERNAQDESLPRPGPDQAGPEGFGSNLSENLVQTFYPDVDFAKLYPGWSAQDIDQMQRECFAVRYVYEPFVQFKPVPVKGRFVEVTEAGYRRGASGQPWPPRAEDLVSHRRVGKWIYHSLASEEARRMMELLYELFCQETKAASRRAAAGA